MLTPIRKRMQARLRREAMLYTLCLLILAMCPPVAGQGLAQDAPTEVERARAKAEKAWQAWEAAGHIESRLFSMPADRALAAIDRDSQLADEYLSARQQQLNLLSRSFLHHAEALANEMGTRPDMAKLRDAEQRNLAGLLEGDLSTKEAMTAAERDPDPARRAARRQAVERESEQYKKLQDDARERLELLQMSQQSTQKFDRNERALVETLRHLGETLQTQAAAYGDEREMWRTYHKDLENLVLHNADDDLPNSQTSVKQ